MVLERILDEYVTKCDVYKQNLCLTQKDIDIIKNNWVCGFREENGDFYYKAHKIVIIEEF